MPISLIKALTRNTQCHIIKIGDYSFLFSYETAIACINYRKKILVRRHNEWGPTTGRHINEYGVKNYPEVTEEQMESLMSQAIVETAGQLVINRMAPTS